MINYKHLHNFWVVAKQGGVARAGEQLHLTPQTISGQINLLDDQLGEALFSKSGRNLVLTETGRLVMNYADEIFTLGQELEETVRNLPHERPIMFQVGIADVVPKMIAHRLLEPVLSLPDSIRLQCRENSLDNLLAELSVHRLDMVLADGPVPAGLNVQGFNHALGECGISFLATPALAADLVGEFPHNLDSAPLLMPSDINRVHARLLRWFEGLRIYPRIVGEFDDSALMKVFGQAGAGIFVSPTANAAEVAKKYDAEIIGATEEIREQFYAISAERRISHPAVLAITRAARVWLN